MLELRPLRDEMRGITTKWLWRYRFGRATLNELDAAFADLNIREKEAELLKEKAALDYEDELIDEQVEICRWNFRTARISADDFLNCLLDLGIRREKANLMVELEQAKGYYGYY